MASATDSVNQASAPGEPTWDIAYLFPWQGDWTEIDYFGLDGNHLLELANGYLEVLPMPTSSHQFIVAFLYRALLTWTTNHDLGTVLFAPLPVRLWNKTIREPDVVFMLKKHAARITEKFWKGADLVMEVVSGEGDDRARDLVVKRAEYARAGIPEYWIIEPRDERLTVLRLADKQYVVHGEFLKEGVAASSLLNGSTVNVKELFAVQLPAATKKSRRKKN